MMTIHPTSTAPATTNGRGEYHSAQNTQHSTQRFRGFESLNANYLYCPNQFFDVCLPNHSRGVIRLVAYVLRKTLGWLDENGNPVEQNINATYRDLITKAGVSRGAIRKAIDEAIAGGFISCTREPRVTTNGRPAQTARYTLRWDTDNQYLRDAGAFGGFYAAEGHRSPIPNAFFDRVIPHETLGVVKVVGTVLRHTVGYQNQFGGRRSHAPLSYSYIQKVANLSHRPTLAEAVHESTERGYIRCVSEGRFDPHGGGNSRPASYAVKWLDQAAPDTSGSKTEPAETKRSKNRTGLGPKTEPAGRSKNRTGIKTNNKDTFKQQPAAVDFDKAIDLLIREGFDERVASHFAKASSFTDIQNQIAWIDARKPKNRLGMLRTAIEQNWGKPDSVNGAVTPDIESAERLAAKRKMWEQLPDTDEKEAVRQFVRAEHGKPSAVLCVDEAVRRGLISPPQSQ